jgi:glycosyltransferase involved in cell wall biosynthesis
MNDTAAATHHRPVAIVLPSLAGGGAERVMLQLAHQLLAQGLPVELLLAQVSGPYLADVDAALPLRQLGGGGVLRSLVPLVRYLKQRRPQVVLAAMTHMNVVALLAARLAAVLGGPRCRVVVSERSALSAALAAEPPAQRVVLCRLLQWLYPQASSVLAVSDGVACDVEAVAGLPTGRVRPIANPLDVDDLRTRAQQPLVHPWLEPGSPPLLLAAGRLEAEKDFLTLLQAVALLVQERPLRLIILGEGSQRRTLEARRAALGLDAVVALPGFSANPMAWMGRAAGVVLSSRWEGLPGVLLQAMACGAPVVSTDCPHGPREILENGAWGELVPVGDAPALAAAISRLLASPAALVPPAPQLRPPSPRCRAYSPDRIAAAYRAVLLP